MWEESDPRTPLICLLSMGSDPTDSIIALGKRLKIETHYVSMGQGQEVHARKLLQQTMANVRPHVCFCVMLLIVQVVEKQCRKRLLRIVKHLNLNSACRLLNRKSVSIRTLSWKSRYHLNLLLLSLDLQKTSPPKTSISLSLHTAKPTPDPKPSVMSMVPPPPPYTPPTPDPGR